MNTKKVGNLGEKIAEKYLKDKGYQILDRNYSFRIPGSPKSGEIDIVAQKDGIISFIEVKTLFNKQGQILISPEEKVNFSKQKKLIKTAESWLMKKKIPLNSKWQIDIVSIEVDSSRKVKINHFPNAISYQ